MKDYLIWYRLHGDTIDRIRGTARNWHRAEKMAENLHLNLISKNIDVETVGVKSGVHGELYEDDTLHMRWSVIPPEPEQQEEQ
jgi:hypothetical protein